MLPIKKIQKETDRHVTVFFEYNLDFKPGQFVMLWHPRVDEKPFTISYHSEKEFAITIEAKGKFTKSVVKLKKGDKLGVRGPFGNGFKIKGEKVCVVAGGCGMAPVSPLIEELVKQKKEIIVIQGARNKGSLLFNGRFDNVKICTDDGTSGHKGFVTEVLSDVLNDGIDTVYTCGPEIMMKKVFEICEEKKVDCQASLERYMRCGFGICGACVCGKERVCVDGPVFDSKKLRKMEDFGKGALLKSGKEVDLSEYFSWRCK